MKFPYKKYGTDRSGRAFYRPVIPIEVGSGEHSVRYEVLIDSGADVSIFDADIAAILGIKLTDGKRNLYTGITGSTRVSFVHPIAIQVGGWSFKTSAAFAPSISRDGHGIVGQRGFFDLFVVKFDYAKKQIELKPKP